MLYFLELFRINKKEGDFMKHIFTDVWSFKRCLVFLLLFFLIAIIGIPVLINWLFKLPAPVDFLVAEWTADGFLGFYGAILTFFGTVLLSMLALWQNQIIKEENNKHTALLERMEREKNAPYFSIENIAGHGKARNLTFSLKNASENTAHNISVSQIQIVDKNGKVFWEEPKVINITHLGPLELKEIHLHNPPIQDASTRVIFCISYSDKFNELHKRKCIGSFTNEITIPTFSIQEKDSKL